MFWACQDWGPENSPGVPMLLQPPFQNPTAAAPVKPASQTACPVP